MAPEVVAQVVAENAVNRIRISPFWCVVRLPAGKVQQITDLSLSPPGLRYEFQGNLAMPRWPDGSLRFVRLIATDAFSSALGFDQARNYYDVLADTGPTVHPLVGVAGGTSAVGAATMRQTYALVPEDVRGRGEATAAISGGLDLVGSTRGTSNAAAALGKVTPIEGIAVGRSTVGPADGIELVRVQPVAGSTTGTSTMVGTLAAQAQQIAGSTVGTSTCTGGIEPGTTQLVGFISAGSSAAASLTVITPFPISGSTAGASSAAGNLSLAVALAGAASGQSSAAGALVKEIHALQGAAAGSGSLAGAIRIPQTDRGLIDIEGRVDRFHEIEGLVDNVIELEADVDREFTPTNTFPGRVLSSTTTPGADGVTRVPTVPIGATSSTGPAPLQGGYVITLETVRLPGADAAMWADIITVRDPSLNFAYWWFTVGFSIIDYGPEFLDVLHKNVDDIRFPLEGREVTGGKVGVYHANLKEPVHVVQGETEFWTLVKSGVGQPVPHQGNWMNGQACSWRGAMTDDIRAATGVELSSALAAIEAPIYAVCTTGEESWVPFGVVPPRPRFFADDAAARLWLWDKIAARNLLAFPPLGLNTGPWYSYQHFQVLIGDSFPYYGHSNFPRQSGGSIDFSNIPNPWMAIRCKAPMFLAITEQDAAQEWCRNSFFREGPTFRGGTEGPAAPYAAANHPGSHWLNGYPFLAGRGGATDSLGKLENPDGEALKGIFNMPRGTTNPDPNRWMDNWFGLEGGHFSINHLVGHYMLTGDWMLERLIQAKTEEWISTCTVNTGRSGDSLQEARTVWRTHQTGNELYWCTNNETLRAQLILRTTLGVRSQWQPARQPSSWIVRPVIVQDLFNAPFLDGWSPYQNAGCVVSFYGTWLLAGAADRPTIMDMVLLIGESNMAHSYEDKLKLFGVWKEAHGIRLLDGTPQNEGTLAEMQARQAAVTIVPQVESQQEMFAQGCARLIAAFGRTGTSRDLGRRNSVLQERPSTATTSGWDNWADFFYVLEPGLEDAAPEPPSDPDVIYQQLGGLWFRQSPPPPSDPPGQWDFSDPANGALLLTAGLV